MSRIFLSNNTPLFSYPLPQGTGPLIIQITVLSDHRASRLTCPPDYPSWPLTLLGFPRCKLQQGYKGSIQTWLVDCEKSKGRCALRRYVQSRQLCGSGLLLFSRPHPQWGIGSRQQKQRLRAPRRRRFYDSQSLLASCSDRWRTRVSKTRYMDGGRRRHESKHPGFVWPINSPFAPLSS